MAKKTTKQTEYVFPSACCKNRKSRKISIGGWLVRFECRCGNVFKDKSLH